MKAPTNNRLLFGPDPEPPLPPGLWINHTRLDDHEQGELMLEVQSVVRAAPLITPTMPASGVPFRLQLTNAGSWGWVSDTAYRYSDVHPVTKKPWPPIPARIAKLSRLLAEEAGFPGFVPDSLLINVYVDDGRLGLHRDSTENDPDSPIVSISLGDSCIFAFGGLDKKDPLRRFTLRSGACVVFGGPARMAYHAVEKIIPLTSPLYSPVAPVRDGVHTRRTYTGPLERIMGRVNLTVRRAKK